MLYNVLGWVKTDTVGLASGLGEVFILNKLSIIFKNNIGAKYPENKTSKKTQMSGLKKETKYKYKIF